MESCLPCVYCQLLGSAEPTLIALSSPSWRQRKAECALRYWELLVSSAGCGSVRQKCDNGSELQNNLFLNILWTFMSFLCVPNYVHQVSLPFWVIVLQDLDVSLEEQLSLVALVSLTVTRTPWSPRPQVALLLELFHLHLGLGQRIPVAHPHHVLHWPLLFHIEINTPCRRLMRTKRKRKKTPKIITNKKNHADKTSCPLLFFLFHDFQKEAAHGEWFVLSWNSPTFMLQEENSNLEMNQSSGQLFWVLKMSVVKEKGRKKKKGKGRGKKEEEKRKRKRRKRKRRKLKPYLKSVFQWEQNLRKTRQPSYCLRFFIWFIRNHRIYS